MGLDKAAGKLYHNRCRDTGRTEYGVLAQLGERKVRNIEVRGSIPLCSTKFKILTKLLLIREIKEFS